MSASEGHDRVADFFGRPHRWRDLPPAERKRFTVLWQELCAQQPQLTLVEHASVIRTCREKRDDLSTAMDRLKRAAMQGDKVSDAAARTLEAELSILKAAIRVLWLQSGKDPPDEDR